MRFLGLDVGTKTLGVAISDRTNTIASPLITIHFKEMDFPSVIPKLKEIIKTKEITDLVLGWPKNMDNTEGFAVTRTKEFKKMIETLSLPIHLVDERLSSQEAEKLLISTDVKRIKRKKVVDNVAAAIILDTYLVERRIQNERKSEEK